MKLRPLFGILFLSLFAVGFYSCDDDELKEKNLPDNARTFLDNYFGNNQIVSIENQFPGTEPNGYKVQLNGEITVFFRYNGDLQYIAAESGLPESTAQRLIDPNVLSHLKAKEPNALITKISPLYIEGWLMGLDNGKQYADYYGFEGKGLGMIIAPEEAPETMKEFLKRNNLFDLLEQTVIIQMTESQGKIYRIPLGDNLLFSFDKTGKWIHAEDSGNPTFKGVLEKFIGPEIPANVILPINTIEKPVGSLYEVSRFENNIYGFRFSEQTLLIDELSGIIAPPTEYAKSLFDKYFEPNGQFEERIVISNPYRASFGYRYTYQDYQFFIYLALDNQWTQVLGSKMNSFAEIPAKFVNQEFPEKIVNYLNSNYIQPGVCIAKHNATGYMLYIQSSDERLFFDNDCNFVEKKPFWESNDIND